MGSDFGRKASSKPALRGLAVALTIAVSVPACGGDDGNEPPEVAATTAVPSPTAPPSPRPSRAPASDGQAKVLIVKALRKMQTAFERKDARAVLRRTGPLSLRYLKRAQRATATAGKAEIQKLSVWEKLILTTLRTDLTEEEIAGLSSREFLDYVFRYELDYFPTARLPKRAIEMTSPREGAAHLGKSMIWFVFVDGEWKVEILGAFETMGLLTKEFAKQEGHTTKQAILGLAEEFTEDVVPGDVWQKP